MEQRTRLIVNSLRRNHFVISVHAYNISFDVSVSVRVCMLCIFLCFVTKFENSI